MIIEKFIPRGGHHCITNSLSQIFAFHGYPISEQLLFGLGSGLGFVYVNLSGAPMISGRIKPVEFENNISQRLGIGIKVKKPKNSKVAFEKLKASIFNLKPVMLYVDMPFLPYLNMPDSSHFGGHSIVVFGFDDHERCFYVSDRDHSNWKIHTPKGEIGADFHKVSYEELERARNSSFRPFPANNKWVDFDFKDQKPIGRDNLYEAIRINIETMLHSPANLLGISGIRKFARETRKWKKFDIEKKKLAGITNYFMISSQGGTGGGAFRKMYGEFLLEASEISEETALARSGKQFLLIAELWDAIAAALMEVYNTGSDAVLKGLEPMLADIAEKEEIELKRLKQIIES